MTGTAPRIVATNLTKAFLVQKRRRGKTGVGWRELAEVGDAVRSVLRVRIKEGRRFYALRNVNLEVASGEVVGIIGRNGAGKSTMLKVLARVLDPTEGTVRMQGRVASLLELGAGFSHDLTVAENIALHVALSGGREDPELEERILELAELTEYRDVDLEDCPGGAVARLAFASLISINSDIVLADEMLAVGDERFREMVIERIRKVRSEGGAVLFVSHDLRAIAQLCDRVLWIDRGEVRMMDAAADVVAAYEADLAAKTTALQPAGDSAGRIVELRLVDADGHQVGAVPVNRAFFVECIFQQLRPGVAMTLRFELFHGSRHKVLLRDRAIKATDRPRAFRARIGLPPHFLNDGHYEARVLLRWQDGDSVSEEMMRTGVRAMDNARDSAWGGWTGRRSGLAAPKLRWRVAPWRTGKAAHER